MSGDEGLRGLLRHLLGGSAKPASDVAGSAPWIPGYVAQYRQAQEQRYERIDIDRLSSARAILDASPEERAAAAVAVIEVASDDRGLHRAAYDWQRREALRLLASRLLRSHLPFTEPQLVALVRASARRGAVLDGVPRASVLGAVERHVRAHGLPSPLRDALERLLGALRYTESRKLAARAEALVAPPPEEAGLPLDEGSWSDEVRAFVRAQPDAAAWTLLLAHAATAAGRSKPTKKWRREAAPLVDTVGAGRFVERLLDWLDTAVLGPHPTSSRWAEFAYYVREGIADPAHPALSERDRDVLKGLVWAAAGLDDPRLPGALGRFGERCFRKVRVWGAQSVKLGNATVWALGALPGTAGVAHLSRLSGKVRYATARRLIEKALAAAAKRTGVARSELEELGVPDFGLGADGTRRDDFGDFQAEIAVERGRTAVLRWIRADGTPQKSVPKAVKEGFGDDLKALKAEHKELREVLAGQAGRVERLWLDHPDPWRFADWRERYLEHGLVATLARQLLWTVGEGEARRTVLWHDGALRDRSGEPLADPKDDAPVRLWHPIDAPADEVLAWRTRLEDLGVVQPIKQAWREIYVLTPAEEQTGTYSNRFAAHIVRQHQFLALAQQRGWHYTLQGSWDSSNVPYREVRGGAWRIEWWVEPAPEDGMDGATGYRLLASDQVRFRESGTGEPTPLEDVPPHLFSELMRDVDLFVSVCSIGNDPSWADGGPEQVYAHYWDSWSFGALNESAKTRAAALERLLPRLKIRDVARVEDRWLVVRGKRNTYRIHLGSANIQMDGRGYLCIVPDRSPKARARVMLPFDDDNVLSLVLSKAFLLADDDKITDPSILRQIVR